MPMRDTYVVICTDEGRFRLATRQVFSTLDLANAYARTVSTSRHPKVVAGDWYMLRAADQPRAPHKG